MDINVTTYDTYGNLKDAVRLLNTAYHNIEAYSFSFVMSEEAKLSDAIKDAEAALRLVKFAKDCHEEALAYEKQVNAKAKEAEEAEEDLPY